MFETTIEEGVVDESVAVPPFNSNLKFEVVGVDILVTNPPLTVPLNMLSLNLTLTYALFESISVLKINGGVFNRLVVLLFCSALTGLPNSSNMVFETTLTVSVSRPVVIPVTLKSI